MEVIKKFKPLDESFPLERQLGISAAPIVPINILMVDAADEAPFLENFKAAGTIFTKQLGYVSSQPHRAIGDSPTYLNHVLWESTETLREGFGLSGTRGSHTAPVSEDRGPRPWPGLTPTDF